MSQGIRDGRLSPALSLAVAVLSAALAGLVVRMMPEGFQLTATVIIAVLLLAGLGYLLLKRLAVEPSLGVVLLLTVMPLDVFGRFSESLPLTAFHVVVLLCLVTWLVDAWRHDRLLIRLSPVDGPILFIVLATLFSLPLSVAKTDTLFSIIRIAFLALVYFFITNNVRKPEQLRRILHWLVITGVFFALVGVGQFLKLPGFGFGRGIMMASGSRRAAGFFNDPNFFASFMSVAFLISVALASGSDSARLRRRFGLATAVIAAGLFATYSRTAWIGSGVGVVAILWYSRDARLKKAVAGMLIAVALLAVIPGPVQSRLLSVVDIQTDTSVRARYNLIRSNLEMIADNPLFGVGVGAFSTAYPEYRKLGVRTTLTKPHNLPLAMWAEAGLFGFASLIWLMVAWFGLWRGGQGLYQTATAAAVIAMMVENLFYYFLYNDYLWVMLALSVAAYGLISDNQDEGAEIAGA